MPQSRLVELLGQKAYDYVRELAQHGMIDRRKREHLPFGHHEKVF